MMSWRDEARSNAALLGSGLVIACVLLASSVCWFVLDPLKYAVIAAQRQGMPTGAAAKAALAGLPATAWVLIGATGLAVLAAPIVEIRSRAISAAIGGRTRVATTLTLAGLLLWFGHAYLYDGHLLGGDTGAHIARIAHFADGLRYGELRHWDNSFYGGATLLQFTGPLFFWLGGLVAALVGEAVVATKLVLLALHFFSGWAAYRLLRGFALSRPAAGIGAVIYAGAFAHLHLILYKGALPQAVTLALLPAAFLAVERLAVAPRHVGRAWALTALTVAGLVITHQPHGLLAGLYLAAFVLAGIACGRYRPALLLRCATAAAAAGLLASFAVIPWLAEGKEVMVGGAALPVFWEWPDAAYFAKLVTWSNRWTSQGAASVAYVGLTSLGLAVAAVLAAGLGRQPRETARPVLILFILLVVSFGLRGDFVRDIAYTLFFVALLAGFGAEWLMAWRGRSERVALLAMVLVVLDLGATAVQPVARQDKAYLDAAAAYLSAQLPPRRVVLTNDYAAPGDAGQLVAEVGPSAGPVSIYPVQTLFGPHNMAATRFHNYAVAALERVEAVLRQEHRLDSGSEQLLAMLNVAWIVNDSGIQMGLPADISGARDEGPLGRILPIGGPTPAVFAPRLVEIAPAPDVDKPSLWTTSFEPGPSAQAQAVAATLDAVLSAMRFAPATATAAAIPVRAGADDDALVISDAAATTMPFAVVGYVVEAQRVELRLRVPQAGFVQLAHPWYPHQLVTIDGQEATPLRGTLNLLVLPMPAGEHTVEIVAERSTLRQAFGIGCAASFAVVLAIAAWPRTRRAM